MQFNKKDVIANVVNYKIHPDVLLFTSGEGLKNKQLYINSIDIGVVGVAGYYYLNNQVIFNRWGENDSFKYKCSDGSIEMIMGGRVQNIIDGYVVFMNAVDDVYLYRDYSLSDLFKSKYNFQIVGSNYGICFDDFQIMKIDFKENIFWHIDINSFIETNKFDEIDKILGVIHGNLWFTTRKHKIFAIEIDKGNKVFEYEGFGVYLDDKTHDVFSISSNIITIIDSKDLVIRETYNYLDVDPFGIGKYRNIYSAILQGDYFSFLAEKEEDYGGIRHVGIFDYRARKLVWEHEVISQQECNERRNKLVAPEPLYICGDKLYIKDINSNLHIFQKRG